MMLQALSEPAGTAECLRIASLEPVRLGMPELCRAGLSESWLLKAAGHRHWLALARAYGLPKPDFRTADGARLYPAFTSVRLDDGELGRVVEDDLLEFAVTLHHTGRTRFRSIIDVSCAGLPVARLTMDSAFVQRLIAGRNRSVSRALVARPCALLPPAGTDAARHRDRGRSVAGFDPAGRRELASWLIDPSPHEDFNGADFLYFAAFQAMVDRSEWHWFHQVAPPLLTRHREIAYLGNIELGERVRVTLCGLRQQGAGLDHWMEFSREHDGTVIAVALTQRYSG